MALSEQPQRLFEILAETSPWQVSSDLGKGTEWPGSESLPRTIAAEQLVERFTQELYQQPRWEVYGLSIEHPDMNVAGHTFLRQTPIVTRALMCDTGHFDFTFMQLDLLTAAALLHDLGEAVTGDITYDLKLTGGGTLDLSEAQAATQMIDSAEENNSISRQQLKEIYLNITTSLKRQEIADLLGDPSSFGEDINWEQLRNQFKLYERYCYLITAFQIYWPLEFEGGITQFTSVDKEMVKKWNRQELETALMQGQEVSESVRRAVLTKNVLLNQWPHIIKAVQEGIPSARYLFDNPLTELLVVSADKLMLLNLDLSFFSQ